MRMITKLGVILSLIISTYQLSAYPSINYDWQLPLRNISPIGMAFGGVNQVFAEDFGVADENPALLALRKGTYFSTTFRINQIDGENLGSVFNPRYLLKDKQFTYFSLSLPNFAIAYKPIIKTSQTTEDGTKVEYHDLYLNSYVLSFSAKDESYPKLSMGFNLKFIDGRQVYQNHRKDFGQLILNEFVDGSVLGYSTDLGFTYQHDSILLGLTLKDLVSRLYWNDRKNNHLRQRYSFGTGFYNENSTFQVATQGRFNKIDEQTYHLGYGYSLNFQNATSHSLGLKVGMFSDKFNEMDNISYTLGFGYTISMFRVDISAVSGGFTLNNTDYLFSVTIGQ